MTDLKSHANEYKQYKALNVHDKIKELQLKEKLSGIKDKYGLNELFKSFKTAKDEKNHNEGKIDKKYNEKHESKREIKSDLKFASKHESKYESNHEMRSKNDAISDTMRSARSLTDGAFSAQSPIPSFKSEKLNHLWRKMKFTSFTAPQLIELKAHFDMQQQRIDNYNAMLENVNNGKF